LQFDYVFLDPKFFDPAIYKGIEDRLAKWAGACLLMLREGNPNPNLSKMFKTEGESERAIVGRFLEGIINDSTFQPESLPKGMQRLNVRWDPWVFFDAEQLRQMITFGLQNGVMSPQLAQRAMGVDGREHKALMDAARKDPEQFTPVFEAKLGTAAATPAKLAAGRQESNPSWLNYVHLRLAERRSSRIRPSKTSSRFGGGNTWPISLRCSKARTRR
jgi:hypothetical protein